MVVQMKVTHLEWVLTRKLQNFVRSLLSEHTRCKNCATFKIKSYFSSTSPKPSWPSCTLVAVTRPEGPTTGPTLEHMRLSSPCPDSELNHTVWIVINSIRTNFLKHLLCGFLYRRMQDVAGNDWDMWLHVVGHGLGPMWLFGFFGLWKRVGQH